MSPEGVSCPMRLPPNRRWLTIHDVCATFGVPRSTIYRWIGLGKFPRPHGADGRRKLWDRYNIEGSLRSQLLRWEYPQFRFLGRHQQMRRPADMTRARLWRLLDDLEERREERVRFDSIDDEVLYRRVERVRRAFMDQCKAARDAGNTVDAMFRHGLWESLFADQVRIRPIP